MTQTIKQRLAEGGLIRVAAMGRVLHPNIIQMIGLHGGFHGLWFDLEHTGCSLESLEVATMAARSQQLDSFCRIAPTDYALVTQCLEAGASGIMAAQIHSAEQAEQIVRWTKFHPRGARGLNTGGWDAQYGKLSASEFCEKANQENFVAIQIETAGAVEECEAIAAIEDVDLLFVGPSDLSQSLGVPGDFFHEKCLAAIDRVASACRQHGKQWGAVSLNAKHAAMLVEKGCQLLSPTNDVRIINAGLRAVTQEYVEFFE